MAAAATSPPTGPTAIALDGHVDVAWQPVDGASAYTVYRGLSPSTVTTAVTPPGGIAAPATAFSDTGAVNGTTYYYAVRSVVLGVESANSLIVQATPVARGCSSGTPVVLENCFPGAASWNVRSTATMPSGIEGYATAPSIEKGDALTVKVNTGASFDMEIYRTGWYGGAEARLFSIVKSNPATPQAACATPFDGTGLIDCANWSPSGTITTTSSWPSGVYLVRLVRADNGNDNQIIFVVRDDTRHPDLMYGVGMSTFQAYNNYGGKSLYDFNSSGSNTVAGTPRAVKVSFDRPFEQPRSGLRDWYTNDEIATVAWLERNGYDVGYLSDTDLETMPSLLTSAKAYVSPAHEEYVSAAMRAAMVNARDGGVGLFFTGSNEIYWKIRFETSPTTGAAGRTEVCYKTVQSGPVDPSGISTSTWRDPNGANQPENAVAGQMYIGDNDFLYFPLVVSATNGQDRVYRYTGLDAQPPGTSTTIGSNLVGWEWDARVANGSEPAGVKTLASSPVNGELVQNNGASYLQNQNASPTVVKYRAASGALVVSTGTNHWNRGLALNASGAGEPNLLIQQATVNILADMGARATTPQTGVVLDPLPGSSPAPPSGVTAAAASGDSISISWTPVPGATGYNVYRSTVPRDGGYPLADRINSSLLSGTSLTDIDLNPATSYYYVVTTVAGGVEGAPSTEVSAKPPASAVAPVRINTGGSAYTAYSGASFSADTFFTGGSVYSTTQPISGTDNPALYQNERWGQFSYSIPVPNGSYDVRFHFAELYYGTVVTGSCVGKRIFGMDVLDTPTSPDIQNLDICALVGPRAALTISVKGVQVSDGSVDIRSVYGSVDDPEVVAIDVVPAVAGTVAPTVTAKTPADGATGVGTGVDPTATFSRAMDPTTLTPSSFTLQPQGGSPVAASVSLDSAGTTATLTPAAALAPATTYTATLTTAVKAADGTALASPVSWSFTTTDNQPPTAPGNLQATGGQSQVALSWTASTDNVGVAKYDVYRSTTSGFTPSTSNRIAQPTGTTFTDSGLAAGTYYYLVAAEDAAGNVSAPSNEATGTVTGDVTPPTVSVTAPSAGATVSGTVSVTASASDNVGVVGVQFLVDGANLGSEDLASPYAASWDTAKVANGSHTITAVARDAAGNTTTSAPVQVTVANDTTPPTVAITSPLNGASVTGTVKVTASASDSGSGVASVAFYLDGNLLGTSTTSPYSVTWNTKKTTKGTHSLYAIAKDKAGNSQQSASISVTVR